ncbi:hypothetical protein A9P82_04645 [Arachidicoccus ginsenosidimutans]|uniref:hypothetical protein n=1 Tax=Arachidicoccus sp. BS20 TaxID=1850526 RepID=UPI0007F1495A|nr:hypothetical protein [Arachidicoccus sp. BS20]ANI88637.1 hypothetical protein A9P82_04645 [Arachidicoccus sp. BS20]
MPNRSTDELFQLIKSLEKSEKRNFKLFIKRASGDDDLKIVQLFDALDKMDEYDEDSLLKKNKAIKKQQLSNMKAHLSKQILASLRTLNDDKNVEMQLNEQMAYARILHSKGLYLQSLKMLDKIKQLAYSHNQNTSLLLALELEKKIELLHITRSIKDKAESLSEEVEIVNNHISLQNKLSNLTLQLYGWYIRLGHVRDEKDVTAIELFFKTNLPNVKDLELSFYEKLYLYQAYSWYNFILQDLRMFYRYTQKWLDVFIAHPEMQKVEPVLFIKAFHNLLSAHFDTNNFEKFNEVLEQFETFSKSKIAESSANIGIQVFMYLYTAKINKHFLEGTFTEGITLVPYIEEKLEEYKLHVDTHRVLVFYYKIACLYFGSGDNEKAIDYLNKIINRKSDLRTDLQCYARLLHLIAHYELGNDDLLEYLLKSVYRFMANMKNLSIVEEAIFSFLKKSFKLSPAKVLVEFRKLKNQLEKLENNPLETRSFLYLDIKAWLESKIRNVPVQVVRRERFLERK